MNTLKQMTFFMEGLIASLLKDFLKSKTVHLALQTFPLR